LNKLNLSITINLTKKFKMSSSKIFLGEHKKSVNHFNYYYYTSAFTPDEIIQIREIGDSLKKQKAVTGGEGEGVVSDYRISDIAWLSENSETSWIYEKLALMALEANKEMWNFDIWGYFDELQYTVYYGNGGHYDWHADLGPGISNRKLSCVLQLSDPSEYEGGDLQMNIGSNILTVPKGLGTVCFFPSFVLHRVTPLTSGVRMSLVTWLAGANLR
jgi:PKHD-type hydroxylase